MATSKMKLRVRKKPATSSISQAMSAEASPDSKCPICLDKFKNMAYLDLCLHKFCFRCIHEWSKNKAECPLCKQPFNSIFHSIKAENDFKKYDLRPAENGSFGNLGGQRFRYRTTLTNNRRRSARRTSPPPDNGVMFENLTAPASPRQDRSLHRMMLRLAARQRAENEGRALRATREQDMIKFRRALYRRGVRVRSVRDNGRSRDTTAEFFQRNPACLHRLVPWLRRELMVLYGAHGSLVNIVQHIIMSQITRCNMEDHAIVQELRPFLQARTEHFVHEFINFARSPYNMEAYDQHAVYDCPAPSSEEDSSSNSSVIAISEDEDNSVGLTSNPNSMSGSILSQTPWDDETPGPSYSTETAQPLALSVRDSDSDSSVEEADGPVTTQGTALTTDTATAASKEREHASSGEDDCLIVGFVKPMAERTPELVHLSSDSEQSEKEESAPFPKPPQHIRFSSEPNSPTSIGSSSSKHNSMHQEPFRETTEKGDERSSSEKAKEPSSQESVLPSERPPLTLVLSKHKRSDDRDERGNRDQDHTRSRSGSSSWSRSRSHDRSSHSSRRRSRSRSRDRQREISHVERRHDWHASDYSLRDRDRESTGLPHPYHWHSYNYYSCERDRIRKHHTDHRSSYYSHRASPERRSRLRSRSRTRSRSRSRSRESRRRDKRRSHSRSSSDSRSSRRKSKHEKPGGKRKYKTRHLEEPPPKNEGDKQQESVEDGEKVERSSQEKHRKKSRERTARSPSVEIVYEGMSGDQAKRHHKKKKKHKKKSKRHKERTSKDKSSRHSPVVITIDSDSDREPPSRPKDFTLPIGSNSDVDDAIPSLTPPLVSTANPTDSCSLDSIFHQWEQQFSTVGQNLAASALATTPDPITVESVPAVCQSQPLADVPKLPFSPADILIGQSGQLANKAPSDPQKDVTNPHTPPPPPVLMTQSDPMMNQSNPLVNQSDSMTSQLDLPIDKLNNSSEHLDPLTHRPMTHLSSSPPPLPSKEEPVHNPSEPTIENSLYLPNQGNLWDKPRSPTVDHGDKQQLVRGPCDLPLEDC